MKRVSGKRVLALSAAGAVLVFVAAIAYIGLDAPHPPMHEYSKVMTAAQEYRRDLEGRGVPVPSSVTLSELIARDFLHESDAAGFAGTEVTVSLSQNAENPTEALMRVRLQNGDEIVALSDGSVQQLSR